MYDTVDIYNASTGRWTTDVLSIPRQQLAAASLPDLGLAFFAGGQDASFGKNIHFLLNLAQSLNCALRSNRSLSHSFFYRGQPVVRTIGSTFSTPSPRSGPLLVSVHPAYTLPALRCLSRVWSSLQAVRVRCCALRVVRLASQFFALQLETGTRPTTMSICTTWPLINGAVPKFSALPGHYSVQRR